MVETMELQNEFMKTDVGTIPRDWEVTSIQKLCELTSSKRIFENEYIPEGIPFYRGKEISLLIENKQLDNEYFISESRYEEIKRQFDVPSKGDILITAVGTLGNVYLIPDNKKFYFKDGNLIWLKKVKGVNPKYLSIQISNYKKQIINNAIGSSQKALTIVVLKNQFIPLPPTKAEQTAIATALNDADVLITQLEKLIAKKRAIKQGAMQELLKAKEGWVIKRLGKVLKVKHGKSQKEVNDDNGIYPILASGGVMGRSNRFLYNKPSVLIGRKGTIDKPQFMNIPFWTVDTLFYTEIFENYDAKFIFYIFNLIDWYSYNEASGVPSLNAKTIEMIEKGFPVTKAEQTRIAKIISDMDIEIEELEKKLEKYKMIKQGMMQNLLTGKIRLP